MELPSAKDLDVTSEDMDNCPPGTTLSIMPPCREYMRDPMWFDQIGRDPIRARKIFRRWEAGEMDRDALRLELGKVLDEWPRYGPAVHEKAAKEGRVEVVELLIEMGVESDPKTMKMEPSGDDDDEDENAPLLELEHAYLTAIVEGHLDIVKLFVEKGGVPVNYEDKDDGNIALLYALSTKNVEMVRWLLERGVAVTPRRDVGMMGDIPAAVRAGELQNLEMVLAHPQAAGCGIMVGDLAVAAWSGNVEMMRFVLRSPCFGIQEPDAGLVGLGQGQSALTAEQREAFPQALAQAADRGSLECVKLLLKQLTAVQPDGTFVPFSLPDGELTSIYNAVSDALEREDTPELFQVLWDTLLHHPPSSQDSIDRRIALPPAERFSRLLISTAAMGRLQTVRLLIQRYGVDVNHVSHKYFSTPLGRCAGSGANPLPGRLEVAEYLCGRPDLSLELANGEFCNGETSLALAVHEAYQGRKRQPEQAGMVRLLLKYGGPVDEVSPALREAIAHAAPEDEVGLHVLWMSEERRRPVVLSDAHRDGALGVVIQYSARDLRGTLRNVKIRGDDAHLKASDPRGRPLMPESGGEVPEEQRAQATMLQANAEMADT